MAENYTGKDELKNDSDNLSMLLIKLKNGDCKVVSFAEIPIGREFTVVEFGTKETNENLSYYDNLGRIAYNKIFDCENDKEYWIGNIDAHTRKKWADVARAIIGAA